MHTHSFIKQSSRWFIELPEYIEQGGSEADLEMVEGADTMLDIMAKGELSVMLALDDKPFKDADKLLLVEECDPEKGGAMYLMPEWEGDTYNHRLWLCDVTEFVFGYLPEVIFVKREMNSDK